jgi:hypothetical protein
MLRQAVTKPLKLFEDASLFVPIKSLVESGKPLLMPVA